MTRVAEPIVQEWDIARHHADYPRPSTVQHWQLRHLIACVDEFEVYVVYRGLIELYDTRSNKSTTVLQLEFSPTAIDVNHGYLAACGQEGQVVVYDLEARRMIYDSAISLSIINAVHISRCGENDIRLLIPTNDCDVRIYQLPSMAEITTLKFNVPVNYTCSSPDGTKVVAVGDSNEVALFDVHGNDYFKMATFYEMLDHGFSCSFHPSSGMFASASQDGLVCVFDVRMRKAVAKLYSKQRSTVKGACRTVKFAQKSTMDLLAFAEHVTYFHVVDARTFQYQQTFRAAPIGPEGILSGLAFSPSNSRLYVGLDSFLSEYALEPIKRRTFASGSLI